MWPFNVDDKKRSGVLLTTDEVLFDTTCKHLKGCREQGPPVGTSTCPPPVGPGFDSRSGRHMYRWVEFVIGTRSCS